MKWKRLLMINHFLHFMNTNITKDQYYTWLHANLPIFFGRLKINNIPAASIIAAHESKCHQYEDKWNSIPFPHGAMIFLLTFIPPFSDEVNMVKDEKSGGWIDSGDWVMKNYARFQEFLPEILIDDRKIE